MQFHGVCIRFKVREDGKGPDAHGLASFSISYTKEKTTIIREKKDNGAEENERGT